MPNFKITQLPPSPAPQTNHLLPIVDTDILETQKVEVGQLIDLAANTITSMPNLIVSTSGNFTDFKTSVVEQLIEGAGIQIDADGTISALSAPSGAILVGNGSNPIDSILPSVEGKILKVVSGTWTLADDLSGSGTGGLGTLPSGSILIGDGTETPVFITASVENNNKILKIIDGVWTLSDDLVGTPGTGIAQITSSNSNITVLNPTGSNTVLTLNSTLTNLTSISSSQISASIFTGSFKGNGSQITDITASNINNFTGDVRSQFSAGTGITINNGQISASNIPNSSLQSSSITIGTTSISLGGTATTIQNIDVLTGSTITGSTALFTSFTGSFSGNGSQISSLNVDNVSAGILDVQYGGSGVNNLPSGSIIIGNGTNPVGTIAPISDGKVLKVIGGVWALGDDLFGSGGGGGSGIQAVRQDPNNNIIISNQTGPEATASLNSTITGLTSISSSQISSSNITGSTARFTTITGSFSGDGSQISSLNVDNVSNGILDVQFGGTGLSSLSNSSGNGVLVGNGPNNATLITGTSNGQVLKWNNTTKTWAPGTDLQGGGTTNNAVGPDNSIQIKNGASTDFTGSAGLIWDFTNFVLGIGGTPTQTLRRLEIINSDILVNNLTIGRGPANNIDSVAIGRSALGNTIAGATNNVAIGSNAGSNVISGDGNIFIGFDAGTGLGDVSNTIVLRAGAERIRVDSNGNVGINKGGASINARLDVNGSAIITGSLTVSGTITELSTRAAKDDINILDSQLDKIMLLNPVSYVRKDDSRKEYGFISEELKQVYPEFVLGEAVAYAKMVSILTSAVKELTQKLNKQQEEIEMLKGKI